MLANNSMKEVKDADGQTVLKGMSAAVGICHGPVIKVCPHSTTGDLKANDDCFLLLLPVWLPFKLAGLQSTKSKLSLVFSRALVFCCNVSSDCEFESSEGLAIICRLGNCWHAGSFDLMSTMSDLSCLLMAG